MTIDLDTLSAKELSTLIANATKRQTTLSKRKPLATVRDKLTGLARADGYSIAELFGGSPRASAGRAAKKTGRPGSPIKGRKLGKVAPKYRNPGNSKETWSGRGKQPRWMAAMIKKGKKQDDFLIKN